MVLRHMLLKETDVAKYGQEITSLYEQELGEIPKGLKFFGIFSGDTLQAVASLKNYMGSWYLRGCVVKPDFRGHGLQRALIEERLEYLSDKTTNARVSVFPGNIHSIANIEATGFQFERKKKLESGHEVLVYKFEFNSK